ncbi:hypothetical protein TSUD_284670 [Trifolium subterraneum]|uniref:Reverse transcriptase zinc-binding domain-containing protein n=1 Tax=Trifolium subterraneum TaxID=3900 RepID=A0A2Z6PSE3_TRISU|nr:hypothetical protein TSUD_284670 [Trifolium subterraneum]
MKKKKPRGWPSGLGASRHLLLRAAQPSVKMAGLFCVGAPRGCASLYIGCILGSKWEIEKFTGSKDFVLWKVKVRAILTQQKCDEALKGEAGMPANLSNEEKTEMDKKAHSIIILCLRDKVKVRAILTQQKCDEALKGEAGMPANLSNEEKTEMDKKAHSIIILCLRDKVLREVAKEKTAVEMRTKHDLLDCPRRGGGGNSSAQIAVSDEAYEEGYESAGALILGEAVIRILRFGLERRWNNTQHQPGEAVIRILRFSLERRWNNTQHRPGEANGIFEALELVEGGVIHLEDGKACKVQGESHSGTTGLSLWWRNLGLRWSLLLVRLEEDKQSTIAFGYLGDREESGIVGPKKGIAMETLWEACGTYLKFQGKHLFESTERFTSGVEDGVVFNHVELARWRVGNGRDTLFWLDPWLEECPLQRSFCRLYDLAENKSVSVADMFEAGWGIGGETWKWRRRLFAWEEELVLGCVGKLANICLQVDEVDRWVWKLHSSQSYSVKSAYSYLSASETRISDSFDRKEVPLATISYYALRYVVSLKISTTYFFSAQCTVVACDIEVAGHFDAASWCGRCSFSPILRTGWCIKGLYKSFYHHLDIGSLCDLA